MNAPLPLKPPCRSLALPITPLCTPEVAVNHDRFEGILAPIRCKRWTCPTCAEINRGRVIAIAKAAKPRALLTLTVSSTKYPDVSDAAEALKKGLRLLRLRLKRHEKLRNFEFLAVFEKHKSGHPHLHLLIKGDYIPWQWLKRVWRETTGATRIDIRKIKTIGQAAMYCAKYIGKDLSSFPGCKRWWRSSGYSEGSAAEYKPEHVPGQWGRVDAPLYPLRMALSEAGYSVEQIGRDRFRWRSKDPNNPPPPLLQILFEVTGMNIRPKRGW